jgi:hypothetical protein
MAGTEATVCVVGDTPHDVRAARGAGGRVIAMGTGIFKVEDLACHGPDTTIGSCGELLSLLGPLHPLKPKILSLQESRFRAFQSRIQSWRCRVGDPFS